MAPSCVVHQDVELPQLINGSVYCFDDVFSLKHVTLNTNTASPNGKYLFDNVLYFLLVAGCYDNIRN